MIGNLTKNIRYLTRKLVKRFHYIVYDFTDSIDESQSISCCTLIFLEKNRKEIRWKTEIHRL